jgi:(2Fe-2S) ferredoxin
VPSLQRHVFVCINERAADNPKGSCKLKGSVDVRDRLKAELSRRGLSKIIRANNAGCLDQCEHGITVVVYPEQAWYGHVTVDDIAEIVEKHLVGGELVARLLLPDQPHLGDRTAFPALEIGAARQVTGRVRGAAGEGEP